MTTVYILGAGASHDLSFRIGNLDAGYGTYTYKDFLVEGPLSSGYFYYFNRILKTVKENVPLCPGVTISDNLLTYIYKKCDITKNKLLDNKESSQKVNIENLYIDIETSMDEMKLELGSDPRDFSLLQNPKFVDLCTLQHDLKKYIFDTLSFIGYYCSSKYHQIFAEHIIDIGASVISFNWDTLLDEALFNTKRWSCETGYGFKFEKILYKNNKDSKLNVMPKGKNIILKPHGSINWYSDMHKEKLYLIVPVGLKLRGGTLGQLSSCESISEDSHVFNYIIPPGEKRKQFPQIWKLMHDILQNADKIIAVGFSFNNNDSHIREEFDNIQFKRDVSIGIIDPNSSLLVKTYKEVFKTENVAVKFSSFADYCNYLTKARLNSK
ncbi:SIR2 family protein [Patescibacteria group bacterium]|nr:SIR2 family protein [Patescibacteria group bacterium]